jgi:hypothetical protein
MGGKHPVQKYPTIDVFVLRVGFVFSRSSSKVAKHPKGSKSGCGAVVAHNLAKVRVASSNLVIRSSVVSQTANSLCVGKTTHGGLAERLGSGLQSRPRGFESRIHLQFARTGKSDWRSGSALP